MAAAVTLLAAASAFHAPALPLLCAPPVATPSRLQCSPKAAQVISRYTEDEKSRKREMLVAKGLAGAALLRLAYSSRPAAILAAVLMGLVVITPVVAVEAVLLTLLLIFLGAANYWPSNLMVMGLGTFGFAGVVNGLIMFWEKRRAPKPPTARPRASTPEEAVSEAFRDTSRPPPRPPRADRDDDDGSGGLVALLIGALTAAIVGALP